MLSCLQAQSLKEKKKKNVGGKLPEMLENVYRVTLRDFLLLQKNKLGKKNPENFILCCTLLGNSANIKNLYTFSTQ